MKFPKQPRRAGKCCRKLSEWSEKLQNQAKRDCVFGEQKHVCWRMVENPPDSSQKPVEAPQIPVKHKYGAHACPLLLVLPGKVLQQGASFPSAQLELRTAELPGFNSTFSLPLTSRHLIMCFSMTTTLLTQVPHRAGHGRGGAQPCGHRPGWPVCGRGQLVPLGGVGGAQAGGSVPAGGSGCSKPGLGKHMGDGTQGFWVLETMWGVGGAQAGGGVSSEGGGTRGMWWFEAGVQRSGL